MYNFARTATAARGLLRGTRPSSALRGSSLCRLSTSARTAGVSSSSSRYPAAATALAASLATLYALNSVFAPVSESLIHCDAPQPTGASSIKGGNMSDLPEISHLDPSLLDNPDAPMRKRMETYVKLLQHSIVDALSREEPTGRFLIDSWLRKEGGEGISCVLQDGSTFEKAGVNISVVHGTLPPAAVKQMSADHAGLMEKTGYKLEGPDAEVRGLPFYAAGLSLVVHPKNPFAPTVHFNYRYFELTHPEKLADGSPNPRHPSNRKDKDASVKDEPIAWWFGGGTDLTPMYLFEEDATHFHKTLKAAADAHDAAFYPAWKKWCDKYFQIPHRGEARGIGGIFFDDLTLPEWSRGSEGKGSFIPLTDGQKTTTLSSSKAHTQETLFSTIKALGDSFLPAYLPIIQKRRTMPYAEAHERWQALRRGRYVEFNLVYDRGTKFGLQTPGARIESILMSLPLKARWEYMEKYSGGGAQGRDGKATTLQDRKQADEEEGKEKIMKVLRHPREWA
ncbi:Coproporphyrinogen-III oxidase [Thecaphora frezii]